jgi:flagellar assembly protein FliH
MASPARFTFDLDLSERLMPEAPPPPEAPPVPTVPEDLVAQLVAQARAKP